MSTADWILHNKPRNILRIWQICFARDFSWFWYGKVQSRKNCSTSHRLLHHYQRETEIFSRFYLISPARQDNECGASSRAVCVNFPPALLHSGDNIPGNCLLRFCKLCQKLNNCQPWPWGDIVIRWEEEASTLSHLCMVSNSVTFLNLHGAQTAVQSILSVYYAALLHGYNVWCNVICREW